MRRNRAMRRLLGVPAGIAVERPYVLHPETAGLYTARVDHRDEDDGAA